MKSHRTKNFQSFGQLLIVSTIAILHLGSSNLTAQKTLQVTPKVYKFIGNGNWSKSSNWQGSVNPPGLIPKGDSIIILPATGDSCVLDIAQYLDEGAVLKIVDGISFIIKNGIVKYVPAADSFFTDPRDEIIYPIKKIGDKIWMTSNINYYQVGSILYENDTANAAIYGRLYSWDSAKKACPIGWHTPSRFEWEYLYNHLARNGYSLRDTLYWTSPNIIANNSTGFSARPGGIYAFKYFEYKGETGIWWSSTEGSSMVGTRNSGVGFWLFGTGIGELRDDYKWHYASVRCIKD